MSLHDSETAAKPFASSTAPLTLTLSPVGRRKLRGAAYSSWVPLAPSGRGVRGQRPGHRCLVRPRVTQLI
jgi:hypothetical protein